VARDHIDGATMKSPRAFLNRPTLGALRGFVADKIAREMHDLREVRIANAETSALPALTRQA
jgi:hypothetical protein